MKLTIESNEEEGITASFEGKIIDAVEAIAEVMIGNNQLAKMFQAAIEVYDNYQRIEEEEN